MKTRNAQTGSAGTGEKTRTDEVRVPVFTEYPALEEDAASLAQKLSAPLCTDPEWAAQQARAHVLLHLTWEGLALEGAGLKLLPDFTAMRGRVLGGKLQHEFLAKVSRIRNPDGGLRQLNAIDATAGLGEDSFILAACGYQVLMYERDPVIAALLEDCLRRAAKDPQLAPIAARMKILQEDSIPALRALAGRSGARPQDTEAREKAAPDKEERGKEAGDKTSEDKKSPDKVPDLIYLDPMFPQRRKSALIGKKLQLLQKLEQPCMEEADLLQAALEVHPRRIVIKRPLKGPYLNGKKPHYSLEGKAIRYDCFTFA